MEVGPALEPDGEAEDGLELLGRGLKVGAQTCLDRWVVVLEPWRLEREHYYDTPGYLWRVGQGRSTHQTYSASRASSKPTATYATERAPRSPVLKYRSSAL